MVPLWKKNPTQGCSCWRLPPSFLPLSLQKRHLLFTMTNSSLTLSSLDAVYITIEFVIGISATLGNILVIWTVKLNPAFQTNTFYLIVSLALADIAVGILVIPLAIVVSLEVVIHFYSCLFMCCLLMVFTNASILSLLAIAIDRYLRVKLPTR